MLGVAFVFNAVKEITELAAKVAGLPEPQDSPPGELTRSARNVDRLQGGSLCYSEGERLFKEGSGVSSHRATR
jgi:hypothetical protein